METEGHYSSLNTYSEVIRENSKLCLTGQSFEMSQVD